MAFAAVRARTSGAQTSDSTTHVISMPGGTTTASDVLLCFFSNDGAPSLSTGSTGWAPLGSLAQGSALTGSVWWKRASGSDALTLTTSNAQQSTHVTISVRNAADPVAYSNSSAPSPYVVFPTVSPPQGYSDYLCFASIHTDSSSTTSQAVVGLPSGFGTLQSQNPSGNQSAATFTCEGTFGPVSYLAPSSATLDFGEDWVSFTVALAFEQHDAPSGSLTEPVIRSAASSWTGATGNVTVGRPPGLAAGDLMLAWLVASAQEYPPLAGLQWDRADTTVFQDSAWDHPQLVVSTKLFQRITTANDVAQPSFVFSRTGSGSTAGQIAVHITVFKAGTFNPAAPLSNYGNFTWEDYYATGGHFITSITTVNRGILMGFFGCYTAGATLWYPTSPGTMNYIGRESTGWCSLGAYWQYPPSSGSTSPYTVSLESGTARFTSLAILVNPASGVAQIRTGRGVASGVGKGTKSAGKVFSRTGQGVARGAGRGIQARATSFGSTGRGVAVGAGRGIRAQGIGAALATVGTYLTAASGTSAAVPVPAGVASGTVVAVALWLDAAASLAVTPATNFTELASPPETTGVVCSTRLFWTQASGADSGVYTFSWTGAHVREAVAFTLGRTASLAGTPFDGTARASSAGVVVSASPAVSGTAGQVDELAVWIGGASAQTNWAGPPGWRVPVAATGTRLAVAAVQVTAGGATGAVSGAAATGWGVGWGDAWGQ